MAPADAPGGVYPWLTASLIPRAIAWVSTISADGVDNLAPHSFTTVAGVDPPTLCFTSVGAKDTLANARATGEFVLNIGCGRLLHAMNDSATDFPVETSEFDAAGLERESSATVAPPRVAAAPVAFECRVTGEHVLGDCVMVFGEITHIAVARGVLAEDGLPDPTKVDPLARLGRSEWSRLGEVFVLPRIKHARWQAGERSATIKIDPRRGRASAAG
ncbi:flavin reductase family protein [uncultured Jatrophihabitans sp.]|uniref:flavin reductase family protein n=1 Tax=uncultured Jatrophihabitans sp. TaxID=1610747 RepID=UPI0035CC638C